MEMPKGEIARWCEELESGNWAQGKELLEPHEGTYCCLGVACKLFIPEQDQNIDGGLLIGGFPSISSQPGAPKWLHEVNRDFKARTGTALAELNDRGESFSDIAAELRRVYL